MPSISRPFLSIVRLLTIPTQPQIQSHQPGLFDSCPRGHRRDQVSLGDPPQGNWDDSLCGMKNGAWRGLGYLVSQKGLSWKVLVEAVRGVFVKKGSRQGVLMTRKGFPG